MVTLLHHMVHIDGMINTNVWDVCVQSCSSSQNFDLSWEYTTKQTNKNPQPNPKTTIKPQKRETVFLQTGLAEDSINSLNRIVLFNIDFTQALTGFSSNYTALSWTACLSPKNKEPVPQEFVIAAKEATTQQKAELPSLDLR